MTVLSAINPVAVTSVTLTTGALNGFSVQVRFQATDFHPSSTPTVRIPPLPCFKLPAKMLLRRSPVGTACHDHDVRPSIERRRQRQQKRQRPERRSWSGNRYCSLCRNHPPASGGFPHEYEV